MRKPPLRKIARGQNDAAEGGVRRQAHRSISRGAASVRRRPIGATRSLAGNRIDGPALIEEYASTTVLMPGDVIEVDAFGNLAIAVGGR